MGKIFVTSDWHFGHDRDFVWKARGFNNVHEMNQAIIDRHNAIVTEEDDVYVLGDLTLGDLETGLKFIKQMRGKLHIILGNHDTNTRIAEYNKLYNVVEVVYATRIKVGKYTYFLTHYPCITANIESNKLGHEAVNLFGHTHQTEKFYNDNPMMYHVGMDTHNCTPVLIEDALAEIKDKIKSLE